jgi:hypothetical protein
MTQITTIIDQELDRYLECLVDPLITPPAQIRIANYREALTEFIHEFYLNALIPEPEFEYLIKKSRDLMVDLINRGFRE